MTAFNNRSIAVDDPPAATSNYPSELPPRTQPTSSWKDRNCPGLRSWWGFSLSSYSLATSDKAVLARRICMLVVLGLRTAIGVLSIVFKAFGGHIVSLILGIVLGIMGFFFIARCLAVLGDVKGNRKVLGFTIGRWHFDVFLLAMAIVHLAIFISALLAFGGPALGGSWLALWVVIAVFAWIATWQPEPAPENVV